MPASQWNADERTQSELPILIGFLLLQRLLALAHANLQEFAKAIDHYQSLLATNPDDPQSIVGLAHAYARMDKRTDEMRAAIARGLAKAPDDPLLNFAQGKILTEGADWSEGCQCFLKVLKAGSEYVDLVMNQVSSLVQHRQGRVSLPARWLRIQVLGGPEAQ